MDLMLCLFEVVQNNTYVYCIDYLRNKLRHRKLIKAFSFLEVFESEEKVTQMLLCKAT
jgi:hypothetical protein